MKYLLIAGSPRQGNTNYILEKIFSEIDGEKDILYLREKNINHGLGCLVCDETNKCVQKDELII
ncbi:flavodoxin family protein [Candidatus Falkowbacteria bacterium]|nr:flavodoxin family protein [Candidatus Falkowbacteria bacterium]